MEAAIKDEIYTRSKAEGLAPANKSKNAKPTATYVVSRKLHPNCIEGRRTFFNYAELDVTAATIGSQLAW